MESPLTIIGAGNLSLGFVISLDSVMTHLDPGGCFEIPARLFKEYLFQISVSNFNGVRLFGF